MVAINEQLDNIHFEHKLWLDELTFFLNELSLYEKRLAQKYHDFDYQQLPKEVPELWGQIKIHKNTANDLVRRIKKHILTINNLVVSNGELSKLTDTSHPQVRLRVEEFRKEYMAWKMTLQPLLEGLN